jgi:hypothetical protein
LIDSLSISASKKQGRSGRNPDAGCVVWVGLSTGLTVPAGASALCGFTLWTPGGLPFDVFVDDLVAREALLFTDGFESGDTSAWSGVIP